MAQLKYIQTLIFFIHLLFFVSKCQSSANTNVGKGNNKNLKEDDDFSISAQWASNFLSIVISIRTNEVHDLVHDCSALLDENSLSLIGDETACIWTKTSSNNNLQLTIYLASSATIGLNDTLTIWTHSTELIQKPKKLTAPNIITTNTPQIGLCDDLILDARGTTNVGGREAVFTWRIMNSDDTSDIITYEDGGSHIIASGVLLQSSSTYDIILTVTNWYGASSTAQYSFYKSSQVSPMVTLHGVDEHEITSWNSNENVQIYSDITLPDDCTSETAPDWIYSIEWTVTMDVIPAYDGYLKQNVAKFQALQKLLKEFDDAESLSVSAAKYLQSGYIYEFSLNLQCFPDESNKMNKNEAGCEISTAHELKVDFADIECRIFGGDLVLNDITPDMVHDLDAIALDGLSLTSDTYDSFEWIWDCVSDEDGASCLDLLDTNDASMVNIDLDGLYLDYASSHKYTLSMTVYDNLCSFRSSCIDTISLTINTADADSDNNKILFVTATALRSEINNNDALRVIGSVSDVVQDTTDNYVYSYEWQEVNGLLTQTELAQHEQINLILDSNLLQQGQTYTFRLKVTATSDDNVAYGESNTVSVYIKRAPLIKSDSFQITPSCNNEYESISDLLSTPHTVSISADGDNPPLVYEFGAKINDIAYYFGDHGALLHYEALLSNLYLAPLEESFVLFANVYDAESSVVSQEMECSITLRSYSECIDVESLLDTDRILQQSFVYLQYLAAYDGNDADCVETQILNILNLIHEKYVNDAVDICDDKEDAVQLTQTMLSLLSLINTAENTANLDQIEDLLLMIFDPCSFITQEIGDNLDDLTILDSSVLSGQPAIYYNDIEISSHLSPILSDRRYHGLLFELISSIHSLSASNSLTLYDVLSSSIYIAQMVDISVSISGESHFSQFDLFSVYSSRVVPGESVNVSIQNVDILIPNDNTITGAYVFISAVEINDEFESQLEGFLIGDVVLDITLLSDTIDSSNLPSNIEFTLKSNIENTDADYSCVWYKKEDGVWSDDGCSATVDDIQHEIKCSCQHLTTFAVIYNLHQQDSEADVFVNDESSELEAYAHWILSAIFLMISIYVLFQIYPFCSKKEVDCKHRAVFIMSLVAITSFLYFLICLEYLFASAVSIKVMSLLLLLPHISYLLIFSMLFYTWFSLVHAFNPNVAEMRGKVKKILIGLNLSVSSLLFVYFMLIIFLHQNGHQIFVIASFIWSTLTAIITVIITIYAIISGKVLYETTKRSVSSQSFAAKDWKVVRRLITINSCITLYFLFETVINLYYAINMGETSKIQWHKLLELFVNVFCLISICWMYRESMKRLIQMNLFLVERQKADIAQRRRKTQTTTLDLPSTPPQSMRTFVSAVNSKTKSPTSSPLAPIVEQSVDQKNDDAHDEMAAEKGHKVQNTLTVATDTVEARDSVIIAADIVIPQDVSTPSLIVPAIKHSKQRSFQFYSNLREKFNAIVGDAVSAKNNNDETVQQQNNNNENDPQQMDTTEDAMYDIMCSTSATQTISQ